MDSGKKLEDFDFFFEAKDIRDYDIQTFLHLVLVEFIGEAFWDADIAYHVRELLAELKDRILSDRTGRILLCEKNKREILRKTRCLLIRIDRIIERHEKHENYLKEFSIIKKDKQIAASLLVSFFKDKSSFFSSGRKDWYFLQKLWGIVEAIMYNIENNVYKFYLELNDQAKNSINEELNYIKDTIMSIDTEHVENGTIPKDTVPTYYTRGFNYCKNK